MRHQKIYTTNKLSLHDLEAIFLSADDAAYSDITNIIEVQQAVRLLTVPQRQILLLYANTQSVRHVAKILDVSASKAFRTIKQIQQTVINNYKRICKL